MSSPRISTTSHLTQKRYVAAGDRAYVIGAEDGTFPPMGWHITGHMGGVWAHPIKLLVGYWFQLGSRWLPKADEFISGPGYIEMSLPAVDGIGIRRTEFSPDGVPVVLVRLALENRADTERTVRLKAVVRSDLMTAYPWALTRPNTASSDAHDKGSYSPANGRLTFTRPGKPWCAIVQANAQSHSGTACDEIWGPVPPSDQAVFGQYGHGTGGELEWQITLQPRAATSLWLAIAGSHMTESEALSTIDIALADPAKLLREKIDERLSLLKRTEISVPDKPLEAAFQWAKMNMADLRRTVVDVHVRAVSDGSEDPPPAKAFKRLSGIGAGFPDYPWFFGTDGAYTAYPLIASGQWQTAMDHLRTIREVSQAVNGDTGKVIHEAVTDGTVSFGLNSDPGDTNETAQFAIAVDLVWRWTGDREFLNEMYAFIRAGLHNITSPRMDPKHGGWPEGLGIVERPDMGSSTLDVASYTWLALRSLAEIATCLDDAETAQWAYAKATWMSSHFDEAWWIARDSLYADSLRTYVDLLHDNANGQRHQQKVQQRHWIGAIPMETGLAPRDKAERSLEVLQTPTFTGSYGLYHTGGGADGESNGELAVWTLPNSVMALAESKYGRVGEALFYIDAIAKLLDLEMPGALPEIAPSPAYDPFQPLTRRAMFMQAWSAYGVQWPVIHAFLGIDPNVPDNALSVVPDIPSRWPGLSVRNLRVGSATLDVATKRSGRTYTTSVRIVTAQPAFARQESTSEDRPDEPANWCLRIGQVLPAGSRIEGVTLDEHSAKHWVVKTNRGEEVHVETTLSAARTLVIQLA